MSLTFDPETGEVTTQFLLKQLEADRALVARKHELDRALIRDAMCWRCLPDTVKERLLKKYISPALPEHEEEKVPVKKRK